MTYTSPIACPTAYLRPVFARFSRPSHGRPTADSGSRSPASGGVGGGVSDRFWRAHAAVDDSLLRPRLDRAVLSSTQIFFSLLGFFVGDALARVGDVRSLRGDPAFGGLHHAGDRLPRGGVH